MGCFVSSDKQSNPLVSIIVPVYKVEKYLDRCIQSLLKQTYINIEIILVDDGSPDCCPQMCDDWALRDERIRVIHKTNDGVGMARNAGLEIAKGSYVMFVDSDDYLSPDTIRVLLERLLADQSDMAIGRHTDVYPNGKQNNLYCSAMKNKLLSVKELLAAMATENIAVAAWGKLYRREILSKETFPALQCGEDLWAFPSIVSKCQFVSIVDEEIYYYFQRKSSIIHQKTSEAQTDEIEANLYFSDFLLENGFYQTASKWFVRAINFALNASEGHSFRVMLRKYFTLRQRIKMFQMLGSRNKIEYCLLYMPWLYKIVIRGLG